MIKSRKLSWSPLSIASGILSGGLTTGIDAIVDNASGNSGVDNQGHWDWLSGYTGIPNGSPADAFFGENGVFSNPEGAWDNFMNGQTNTINQEIANQNLQYQKERNEIEDARYEEERDYNRAWAEEEREYNRALQQQLFEREDTAQIRQAQQLSSMGINPLSQQLNGANAGQAVSSATPPTDSIRGGSALHNDFRMQGLGIGQALSALSSLASTVNGVATGQYQRDALALQNDKQFLDNLQKAKGLGINYYGPADIGGHYTKDSKTVMNDFGKETWYTDHESYSGSDLIPGKNAKREYLSKLKNNVYDWESPQTKLAKSLGELDFQNLAENLLTNVANAGNWVNSNFKDFAKDMEHNAIMNFVKKFFAF